MTHLLEQVTPGTEIARDSYPPITRHALAMYAAASGDSNPMHVDIDVAKGAGLPDVFAHGMLVMAYMGRTLQGIAGVRAICSFGTRFLAITWIGNVITCTATLTGVEETPSGRVARIALEARDQNGERKLKGDATVALHT